MNGESRFKPEYKFPPKIGYSIAEVASFSRQVELFTNERSSEYTASAKTCLRLLESGGYNRLTKFNVRLDNINFSAFSIYDQIPEDPELGMAAVIRVCLFDDQGSYVGRRSLSVVRDSSDNKLKALGYIQTFKKGIKAAPVIDTVVESELKVVADNCGETIEWVVINANLGSLESYTQDPPLRDGSNAYEFLLQGKNAEQKAWQSIWGEEGKLGFTKIPDFKDRGYDAKEGFHKFIKPNQLKISRKDFSISEISMSEQSQMTSSVEVQEQELVKEFRKLLTMAVEKGNKNLS